MEKGSVWTYLWWGICIVTILSGINFNLADACDAGTSDPGSHISTAPGATTDGRSFFIETPASACCGKLGNWKLYAQTAGTVTSMLWRPTTGSNYELVYMEDLIVLAGLNTPLSSVEVQVATGDVVGWKTAGAELIPSSVTAGASTQNQLLNPTLNAEVPWSQTLDATNTHAFGAAIAENTAPIINDGSETIADSDTSQVVHTLDIKDADSITFIDDTTVVITATSPTTTDFSITTVGTDFTIESGSSLTPGVYELQISVTDICLDTVTGTVTITVENVPPVFVDMPYTVSPALPDSTDADTLLHSFSVTDSSTSAVITCSYSATTPYDDDFDIRGTSPDFDLYILAANDINYDVDASVPVTVTCSDGTTDIVEDITVDISDTDPVFDAASSLSTAYPALSDATALAEVLTSFAVEDSDDTMTCAIEATYASVASFEIRAATYPDHEVWVSDSPGLTPGDYILPITCSDGATADIVTGTYTVTVFDALPVFVDMPYTVSPALPDSTDADTLLHSFSVTDSSTSAVITCSYSATTPYDDDFDIRGTSPDFDLYVLAANDINYDVDASVPVTVTCSDGTTDIVEDITVDISDTDPVFDAASSLSTAYPALSDATALAEVLTSFAVEDSDDTMTCAIEATYASVASFEIRAATYPDHEVWVSDSPGLTPGDYILPITCSDGATADIVTGTYTVTVFDALPVFVDMPYTVSPALPDSTDADTLLHSFSVTDSSTSAVITCSYSATTPYDDDFDIRGTSPDFDLYVLAANDINYDVDASVPVTVTCSDGTTDIVEDITVDISDTDPVFDAASSLSTAYPALSDATALAEVLTSFAVEDSDDTMTCAIEATYASVASFEIRAATYPDHEVWVSDSPGLTPGDYILPITCSDGATADIVTGTYTVTVFDALPVFVDMPYTVSPALPDSTDADTLLHSFSVTDSSTSAVITCSYSATTPYDDDFDIRGTSPDFDLYVLAANDINYDVDASVPVTVTCSDGTTDIVEDITVDISDTDPVFDAASSLSTAYPALSDATALAEVLTSFAVEDSDDTMTCAIEATYASVASFEIRAATYPYHEVWVSDSPGLTPGDYILPITCSDGTTADIVTGTYTVTVFDAPPVFVDMPYTVSPALPDSTDADTLLHSFSVTDSSTSAVITCSYSATTPYDDDFDIRGTSPDFDLYVLATNDINYDVDASVPVTVTCSDGTTDIVEDITVDISDTDPTWTGFSPQPGAYQYIEDQLATATSLYPFTVEDSDDVITCQVDAPESDHFEIETLTPPAFTLWYSGKPPASLDFTVAESHNVSVTCHDGALYSATVIYQVDLANTPPAFDNLPNGTPTIVESVTSKTLLYTVRVNDTTETKCYLTSTKAAAGISPLEKVVPVTLPVTEYNVFAYHTKGFDFESSLGSISVDISCGDSVGTVTETLIITIENAAPVITNPSESSTILESVSGEVTLKTMNFETFDKGQTTCSMTDNDGGPFDCIDNQIVKTTGALDFEVQSVYNLAVSCTDGIETTTDTHTVTIDNVGPEILNLPSDIELIEEQEDALPLFGLTLSEDATDCSQVTPGEPECVVKFEPTTSLWTVYYVGQAVAGNTLSYEDSPYLDIDIICTDSSGAQGATKRFTIAILDNKAPVFTNIGGSVITTVELNAKEFSATDVVYTITAEDPTIPADDITFTLVQSEPSSGCPYSVSSNGDVTTSVDLHTYSERICTLSVMVEDKYNTNTPSKDLIIRIVGNNTVPVFTNLPKLDKVGVIENAHAIGDEVFQLSAYDPDTVPIADTLTYHCDFYDGGSAYFECDSATGTITTIAAIDYETINQLEYRVRVYVNDGYADSDLEDLTLRILDDNEPPSFTTATWTISNPDEGEYNEVIACPDFYSDISDEDYNEAYLYSMDCPTGDGVFTMDDTGCVTMTKEWDLDHASKRIGVDTITCTVTATDKNGRADSLSTTTTLNIEINEEDDNKPYLSKTAYTFCATEGSTSGTLDSVVVDDNDVLDANKVHTYEFIGAGPFQVDGDGLLTYGDISSYSTGTVFETILRVTDDGDNYDESPVTVVVCAATPSSPSSSSGSAGSSAASSSSTDNMLLWLIPAILLGVLMLGLTAFLLRRCCISGRCGQCRPCMKTSPSTLRAVQPVEAIRPNQPKAMQPEQQSAVPRKERGHIPGLQDLPMTNYYARSIGNLGARYPMR